MSRILKTCLIIIAAVTFLCTAPGASHAGSPVVSFQQNSDGVTFTLQTGVMQLNVYNNVVRVRYSVQSPLPSKSSLMVTETFPGSTSFSVSSTSSTVTLTTSTLNVVVNKSTSAITFQNLQGGTILAEDPSANRSMTATTVSGLSTYTMQTVFDSPSTEALYGLGNFQDSVMNYKGKNETLDQQNIGGTGGEIGLPMLLSNQGYGILWDTYAKSYFYGGDGSDTPANEYRFQIEAGNMIDYYFIYGGSFDGTIASYRAITGQAPMFPKWAYGLFNSYNAYGSQSQVLGVVTGYRSANIPVDCVVQDWHYWGPNPWGSDLMNSTNYPNPAQMLSTMHSQNVHGMISVWGYFASGSSNYTQLSNIGALYPSGYYDAYNATARSDYWQDLNTNLFSNYGWDAWWLDSDEWDTGFPNCCFDRHTVTTALGPGVLYYNSYPLMHTTGVYQGQRATTSAKRVFILSRSSYPGQQRNAAASWSGDINSDWPTFARQIPAGLNFSAAGIPYWCTDIGGYEATDFSSAANNELFTRWFQYGAFCPIFRIHGQGHKELYGTQWSPSTQVNLDNIDNLRYRLMPYIYSLAGSVTQQGYTIMRPLLTDFPTDTNVYGITNQFMFGPAFLVNPVTAAGATSRTVYLPAGTWYDFWTGNTFGGSQTITAAAPLYEIPLFVRAGSIVPMGPMIQYAAQSVDPQEIRVYRGANGSFTLYEDEGDNYDYEQGTYATIPMTYNDSTGTLTIGARSGSFPGMLTSRTFNVVFVQPGYGAGLAVTSSPQTVTYTGSAINVTFASKAPTAPSGLTATGAAGQITLAWNLGAGSYNVYRGTSAGGESATPIATGVTAATYGDTSISTGTTYYYKVAAVSSNGTSGLSNEASATASADAPYGGTPAAIPGTVQAENYDTGGQGIAYNVSGTNGTDNGYRPDGIDLEVTSDSTGGVDLGWNNAGQWFNYTVNVATAGSYTVSFRVASIAAVTGAWHLANAAGTNLTGEVNIPNTSGFGTWTNVTATLSLPAGRQILTFVDDAGGGNVNFDYMTFTLNSASEGPFGGTPAPIPGTVQAENYDTGGSGIAYSVNSTNGTDNGYRPDGIDLEVTSDTNGGVDLGWSSAGQWFKYTVNVATAGTYAVTFRVANGSTGNGTFHLQNSSGTNLTGTVTVPPTGGWQTWTSVTANATLPAGQQILTWWEDGGGFNLNWMAFGAGSCSASPSAPSGLASSNTTTTGTTLNWSAVTPPANCGVSSYTVFQNGTSIGTTGSTSFNVTGLSPMTTYTFTVAATDSFGTGSQSSGLNVTTGSASCSASPSAPTGLTSSNTTTTGTMLNWSAVTPPANCSVSSYTVFQNGTSIGMTGSTSFNVTGLSASTTYTFTVAATDSFGTGSQSSGLNVTTSSSGGGGGPVIQIACGNSAVGTFVADTDFSGGAASSGTTSSINLNNVTNPAPMSVYQHGRKSTCTYTIGGLTAGTTYSVRLDFCEYAVGGSGQRTFNVSINGNQVLTNYDIFANAGGEFIANAQSFTATANSSGQIVIVFTTVLNNAIVAGIEVSTTSGGGTLTPVAQIDAGSPSGVAPFSADTDFNTGNEFSSTATINTSGVSNAAPAAVYQTVRWNSSFNYTIGSLTPNASYTIRLHFVELSFTAAGSRLFNVAINGNSYLSNFDIFATAGGQNKALMEQTTATANSSGQIVISFTQGTKDNPAVAGVEILH